MSNPTTTPQTSEVTVIPEGKSSFTYTPPEEVPVEEFQQFNQSLNDVIGEIDDEYKTKPEDFEDLPAEEKEGPAKPEPEEPEDSPAIVKGLERVVSREVALQAKEAAFQAREARALALEQENAQLRGRVPQAQIQEQLAVSPGEAIKALGHDPAVVTRLLIAEQLKAAGQPIPPELQKFIEKAENTRELNSFKARLAQKENAEQASAYVNAVHLGAAEYAKTVTAKEFPVLADLVAKNADRAHSEIMEEITKDARVRMATDPNGQPMSYPEAAKRVEARLASWRDLLSVKASEPSKQASGKPIIPPQTKTPTKPLRSWAPKQDDVLANGIREAEREFHRLEQARRRS